MINSSTKHKITKPNARKIRVVNKLPDNCIFLDCQNCKCRSFRRDRYDDDGFRRRHRLQSSNHEANKNLTQTFIADYSATFV